MDRDARSDLVGEVRFRVPLPIVIPLGALAVIAIVAVGFAQVLLAVEKEVAVALALVAALNVLGAAAVLAVRPRLRGASMVELAVVVLYPVLIGIVIANVGIGGEAAEGTATEEGPAASAAGDVVVTAQSISFNRDELTVPAGEEFTLSFDNNDTVPHNVAIYPTEDQIEGDQALFQGDIFTGPASRDYEVPALEAGEYYFQCDVHPSMNGTVIASGGGAEAEEVRDGEEGEGGGGG